ncbi:Metallo-beta-lactamase domain-containing protein 2 [Hondaea fermentalgiana]|uniref:Metallo-beta-lactamase domain-containing protein 2 n=1 Tax=Hondaea fermentalgiana TaxID=2315210 RepID=A0A2R5G1A1_9STRA|nr:Metallo-beta-lactamase domain-containing protein 2 [Hondaea fermentalgiana]|eukprot:GBG24305.1 Metallo-beta-lactamase domain-containing protein 2 [Hondaea fermentalgiana]
MVQRRAFSEAARKLMDRVAISGAPVTPLSMNQWVVACKETRKAAIIDGGAPTAEEWKTFQNWLTAQDFTLEMILQTHAHYDHVAGLGLVEEIFEDKMPDMYLHSDDFVNYRDAESSVRNMGFELPKPLPSESVFTDLKDMKQVALGSLVFDILHTPGHAPGHVCFYERDMELLIGGDMIFRGAIGRTDLPHSSPDDMAASLRLLHKEVSDDATILPGHGDVTQMGAERANNPMLSA